ncbi:MAG: OmpH family outer membrane protein [Candidatus Eremiobacteraeota bacterium]|nr:OmpH family outer membrane protein [Candidatus Eremiobacteraeota bacterium]
MPAIAAAIAAAALAACSRSPSATAPGPQVSGNGTVGYVRMEDLVRKHPLYEQLARYDRSIEAFDLTSTAPRAVAADPQLRGREHEIEKELSDAADRTKKLLDDKQKQYQQEENAAIAAALRDAGQSAPSALQIAQRVDATAARQRSDVAVAAQRDYAAFRQTLAKQETAQIDAAQKALSDRADRTYRARADELQAKESALTLKLAGDDASERLALRTKLSSLALDDAAREDAQKQLAALDRKEADALAAQRNRDQESLHELQLQLHQQVQHDLDAQVGAIRKRSLGSMAQRQQALSRQVQSLAAAPVVAPVVPGNAGAQVNPNLPPALRTRIEQLHADYQKRFQTDAKTTIADFQKTRDDLSRRYAELHGVDVDAQRGAQAEIVSLRKKRDDLYAQITAQINREVRLIAQQRGIAVVLTDVVAPAGGVDLTPDAMKDIESLHE